MYIIFTPLDSIPNNYFSATSAINAKNYITYKYYNFYKKSKQINHSM